MMRRMILVGAVLLVAASSAQAAETSTKGTEWSMNATIIEACSCPMFCTCYFDTKPAAHAGHEGHGEEHFCRFNNAFKVNKGEYQGTKLDGAKFWVYGDLGDEFSDGEMEWAVVTFDKSLTQDQRNGIVAVVKHLYPVKWKAFTTDEGSIDWKADKKAAHALIDGGRTAEVALNAEGLARMNADQPMVLTNLRYWGAARNDGFVMMPNTVEAVRKGDKMFEYKGTNGFMITVDINSKDVAE